ncbi:MAG: protein kinase [Cyanobacteria bacterium CRU_2_1]|nr:protein kinase [Cyanobacteria bacterium RU_5_0]NJR58788.1 protein kinase [Cyanobacteria bacterium CRU_2_1]
MIGQLLAGRYLAVTKLGAGGFSETYLARDKYLPHHPLCVVKCLNVSSSSTISLQTAQRLFETEARVLDHLGRNHEQIPTLFAYCYEQDLVYQVQEYIDGENLGNWVAEGRHLTADEAIELLSDVLPILDYTHSQNVIHRDIKPSNLIRRHEDGKIVLIDFGAACIHSEADSHSERDDDDVLVAIGTPGYMPDEQQTGTSQFNSDLYSLGALVIHLLTGVHPREFQRDPISGELDWQIHLTGKPINPKLITVLDRMIRSFPRDRYQTASEVIAAVFPLIGVRTLRRSIRAVSNKRRSLGKMLKPMAAVAVLVSMVGGGWYFYDHSEQAGAMLSRLGVLSQESNISLTWLHDLPIQFAVDRMIVAPDNQILVTAESDHVLRLWSLADNAMLKALSGHTDTVTALTMNQDGTVLVSGSEDRTVRVWDVASGKLLWTFTGHQGAITTVAISSDTRTAVSGSKDGTLRMWDLQSGALLQTLKLPDGEVTAVAYGAKPNSLISANSDRLIQVWDVSTGQLKRVFAGHTAAIAGLRLADNHMLFSFGEDRTLVWDLDREELVRVFSEDSANPMTTVLDKQHIMTVHDNGIIRVWTRETGRLVTTVSDKKLARNLDVALSPNHRYLVCWSPDQRLHVWQMDDSAIHQ